MKVKKYLESFPSLENKKILVTGGTNGIGLAFVRHILNKNANVVLLARNINKIQSIIDEYKDKNIEYIIYDQSDYESIDNAIDAINNKYKDFDILVCNAGIMLPKKGSLSKQGNPLTADTNFIGLYRLLKGIVPYHSNKRYVLQGSLVAGFHQPMKRSIYNNELKLFDQYNLSKAGVEALYYYFYNSNKDNVFVLTEPGVVSTDLFNGLKEPIKTLGKQFIKLVSHKPEKASLTLFKAIQDDTPNGSYIVPRGLNAVSGYPKIKTFPKNRQREYLIRQIKD